MYVNCTFTARRSRFQDFVAVPVAVISFRTPVRKKILLRIAWPGLPKLVCLVGVPRNQRVEETFRSLLFGILAEDEIKGNHRSYDDCRDGKRYGSRFMGCDRRWIQQRHSGVSCSA